MRPNTVGQIILRDNQECILLMETMDLAHRIVDHHQEQQDIILRDRVDQIILRDQGDMWDLVLKDLDTMRVWQRNPQLALLSIIQAIHACNIPLVLPAIIVIRINKEDMAESIMIQTCHPQVDPIILRDQGDQIILLVHMTIN